MSLTDLRRGDSATVMHIPEGDLRDQLLRFGIAPGSRVRCHVKVPFGPVVVRFGGQEIALGRKVADAIVVRAVESKAA